jgi:hypothetical protein
MQLTGLRSNGRAAPAIFLTPGEGGERPGVGGRLGFDDAALRFTGNGTRLRLDVDRLLGMSISGRPAGRNGRGRTIRGTMRVAAVSDQAPAEWIFAIDRSAAARLRTEVNRELLSRGRPELPYIEELESALSPPPALPAVDPTAQLAAAKDDRPAKSRRRKALPWVLLGAVLLIAEVVVPLLLIKGG